MRNFFSAISIIGIMTLAACGPNQGPKNENSAMLQKKPPENVIIKIGDDAPNIITKGALAGNEFELDLHEKLKKGPLVLYFFPKVFTPGCTAEAHEFAEMTDEFKKSGADIIGMSGDDIEGLKNFSKEECRDKFAVAIATPETIKAYNVAFGPAQDRSNRTSFVIGQDGKVKFIYSNLDYKNHVKLTLEAVKALKVEK